MTARELHDIIGKFSPMDDRFTDFNLPRVDTIIPGTTVIPREQVVAFRQKYIELLAFAAYVCGKSMESFTVLDMLDYLLSKANEV